MEKNRVQGRLTCQHLAWAGQGRLQTPGLGLQAGIPRSPLEVEGEAKADPPSREEGNPKVEEE